MFATWTHKDGDCNPATVHYHTHVFLCDEMETNTRLHGLAACINACDNRQEARGVAVMIDR